VEPKVTKRHTVIYSAIKGKFNILFHIQPTPRILLFFIAVIVKLLASALSAIGFVWNNSALLVTGTVIWIIWLAILFMVAIPQTDRLMRNQMHWLKPAARAIFTVIFVLGIVLLITLTSYGLGVFQINNLGEKQAQLITSFENVFAYNDATALCHQATENLIEGNNPYATANIVSAMKQYNGSYDKSTPLREGKFSKIFPYPTAQELELLWLEALKTPEQVPVELESKLGYPAGCFLLPAPFLLLGIEDIRIVYLILILPTLIYVTCKMPINMRLLFIGAVLVSLELWNSVAAGETGSLYFPFLLLAWILPRKHLWLSALFMGVAVATKQVSWFLMPFYLVLIFRTMGLRRMLSVLAIVTFVFFLANSPFIIRDPGLWLNSLMAPMTDNLFPLGVGVVTLVTSGILDIQSSLVFSILEVIIGIFVIVWYYRNCIHYPHVGPLLAILPLFFAWRSLWPYFFYFDIIILAAVLTDEYGSKSSQQLAQVPVWNGKGKVLPVS
jgi:hypothetical protein